MSHSAVRFIAWRLLRVVSVLLAVSFLSFLLLNLLPGSPVVALLGPNAADPQLVGRLNHELGLDHSLLVRYWIWLDHALHGNLGFSYISNQSVGGTIGRRVPFTLEVMAFAVLMALAVAIPLAAACARRPNGWLNATVSGSTLALLALPPFIFGELLIYVFSVKVHLFPTSGIDTWFTIGNATIGTPRSIFLPALTLAVGEMAVFTRVLRSELLATLRSGFITAVRAKGLSEWRILFRHALRPSSLSLLTLAGLSVGTLIAGSVIVEQIFALPGMGRLLVQAILSRDYQVVQGVILLVAVFFVVANVTVEVLYGAVDPRVRR